MSLLQCEDMRAIYKQRSGMFAWIRSRHASAVLPCAAPAAIPEDHVQQHHAHPAGWCGSQ